MSLGAGICRGFQHNCKGCHFGGHTGWGRHIGTLGSDRLVGTRVQGQLLISAHQASLSGAAREVMGYSRTWRTGCFPANLETCCCFNDWHNHSSVFHPNISPGMKTTEEPIMCILVVFQKGLGISQDLDLNIMIVPR